MTMIRCEREIGEIRICGKEIERIYRCGEIVFDTSGLPIPDEPPEEPNDPDPDPPQSEPLCRWVADLYSISDSPIFIEIPSSSSVFFTAVNTHESPTAWGHKITVFNDASFYINQPTNFYLWNDVSYYTMANVVLRSWLMPNGIRVALEFWEFYPHPEKPSNNPACSTMESLLEGATLHTLEGHTAQLVRES